MAVQERELAIAGIPHRRTDFGTYELLIRGPLATPLKLCGAPMTLPYPRLSWSAELRGVARARCQIPPERRESVQDLRSARFTEASSSVMTISLLPLATPTGRVPAAQPLPVCRLEMRPGVLRLLGIHNKENAMPEHPAKRSINRLHETDYPLATEAISKRESGATDALEERPASRQTARANSNARLGQLWVRPLL